MTLHDLYNVRPVRITVCKQGANRQVWFMRKGEGQPDEDQLVPLTTHQEVIIKSDWSAVYCVVAAPGQTENGGLLAPDVEDRWKSADEIRKAAHHFMANGDLSVGLHDAVAEYGTVVENAVAPATFSVQGPDGSKHKITKGSWYVAIAPNDDGRQKIEDGDFNGISIEGTGQRAEVIEKRDGQLYVPDEIAKAVGDGGEWADATAEFGMAAAALLYEAAGDLAKAAPGPDLDRSPKKNWVERVGGFGKTNWIYRAAKWLANSKGMAVGRAIATAINAAKKGCSTGDLNWPGAQSVNMGSRAQMCAAVKKWESMKAAAGVKKSKLSAAQRKKLPASSFVFPQERAYPIHDESHARNALSRASGKPEEKRVRGAVCRKYPAICQDVKKSEGELVTPAGVTAVLDTIANDERDTVNDGLLRTIAKRLGATDDELGQADEPEDQLELAKAVQPTFAELIAERELEDELPKAFDALRSVTWRAFYSSGDEGGRDPADVIATSLDEFKDWALSLVARVDVQKGEGKNAPTPRKCKSCGATLAKDATKCASCGAAYVAKSQDEIDAEIVAELTKAFGPPPKGLIGDGGTNTNNDLEAHSPMTDEETKRIEALEKDMGELKTGVQTLVKAHEDAQEPEAPTIEDLAKAFNTHVEKTGSELETIAKGIAALTKGDTAQPEGGDDQIRKSSNGDSPETIGLLS